jgi:hypothetical protein
MSKAFLAFTEAAGIERRHSTRNRPQQNGLAERANRTMGERITAMPPRFMRTSPHADTCVAWIDISDSVSGSNARNFIGKQVVIGNCNCQIRGAAPRPGSAQCTRCMRWGHHATVCRSKGIWCPLCGGPHSAASHENSCVAEKKDPAARHCLNCSAAKKSKTAHSSTDTSCPFWNNRFDRDWLKRQFSRVAK